MCVISKAELDQIVHAFIFSYSNYLNSQFNRLNKSSLYCQLPKMQLHIF